jgi:hypothetical protein
MLLAEKSPKLLSGGSVPLVSDRVAEAFHTDGDSDNDSQETSD